jgi:hypothetical protein
MRHVFQSFLRDERAAVSVDWVVLTAGVCGLAIGTILILNDGPVNAGSRLASILSNDISTD